MSRAASTLFIASVLSAVSASTHADLVTNGSFETGDFSGWTTDLAQVGSNLSVYNGSTPFGTYNASFAANGGAADSISQLLATNAGTEYTVSLWVRNLGLGNDGLLIGWEGVTVQDYTPLATELETYEFLSFNVFATQNGSLLKISGFDGQAAIEFDAISVVAVPAPGALAGVLAAALLRSRRRLA